MANLSVTGPYLNRQIWYNSVVSENLVETLPSSSQQVEITRE